MSNVELTAQEARDMGFTWRNISWNFNNKSISGLEISNKPKAYKNLAVPIASKEVDVEIPEKIDGIDVVSIGDNAFGKGEIKSIKLHDKIVVIGTGAFSECRKIESVIIPKSVKVIYKRAFQHCSKLQKFVFEGDNIEYIGDGCFALCYSLKKITFPETIKTVPRSSFFKAKGLSEISIPDGVISIEPYAFQACSSLKSIRMPYSLQRIGNDAFDKVHDGCEILFTEFQTKLLEETKSRYPTLNVKMEPYMLSIFR